MKFCNECNYSSNDRSNMRRHVRVKHEKNIQINGNRIFEGAPTVKKIHESVYSEGRPQLQEIVDIRLKENFKLFISGPSRCGKTVFVAKLIENIQSFAKQPPALIIYVYKVWQEKYDEMKSLGVNFMEDNENIVDKIKSSAHGQSIMVIFGLFEDLHYCNNYFT